MGLLNFTREPLPEAVSADMNNLNQLSAQQFSALTEVLFRFLTEPKEVERFMTQLSDFATMNKISLGPLKNIVKSILLVPNGALKRNLSSEQVRADFIALGLSEEKASYFAEQWKVNSPTLTRLAVGQTLMINQLIDMEWKFGAPAAQELEKPPTCSRLPQIPHCKKKVAPSFRLSQQSSCLDPPTALQLLDTLCVFRRVTS
ncbi:COMM domain-containing protein 7 [Turdus rufiventris]|nr:COMM domain-containing protein 7 [Turdus rufiventris]